MMRLIWPCSSSSSMKTTPFAVDGRWRATASPANAISAPVRDAGELARSTAARRQVRPQQRERVDADRQARVPVVGEHPLPHRSGSGSSGARDRGLERQRELLRASLPSRDSRRRGDEPELPEQLSPPPPSSSQAPDCDERARARPPTSPAAGELADRGVGLLRDDAPPRPPPPARADVLRARPGPHRPRSCSRLAAVHVRRPHLDPAPLSVAHERRGRVEAHRLRVEERAEELGRVVAPQPRRLVGEQRERGRVRLREAEAREADELVVDLVRLRLLDPLARAQPATNRCRNASIASCAALAAHRTAQPFGLPDAEPGRGHRDVEHLVLEDDDAERLGSGSAQRLVLDRVARSPGRRAAAGAARCRGARPSPGSAPAGRARPAPSGRRGSPAASGAGSASARGSRSGSSRPCPPPGSRRTPRGSSSGTRERSIGSPRWRRDQVDALLDRRQHPQPEQVDLEEAGVGARVLVPLAHLPPLHRRRLHGHELDSGRVEMTIPPGCWEMWRGRPAISARARGTPASAAPARGRPGRGRARRRRAARSSRR